MFFKIIMTGGCALLMLTLSACQTLTPTECRIANWTQLGQSDGQAGRDEQIANHVDGCAKQQVRVNAASILAYRNGYTQGLTYYCRKDRVLELALAGKNNLAVCPLDKQDALRPYAQTGSRVYDARTAVNTLNREQRQLEQTLQHDKIDDQRRSEIRKRLRELDQDLIEQRDALTRAESALRRLHLGVTD